MSEARTIALLEEILSKTNDAIRRIDKVESRTISIEEKIASKKVGGK